MENTMQAVGASAQSTTAGEKPVYYISNRPEAYEIGGEVSHDDAERIGTVIADHAAQHFPDIEFRVDGTWHIHPRGMEPVTAYIESRWRDWVDEARDRSG